MKKDRKSRKNLIELYHFFDNYYGSSDEQFNNIKDKYLKKYENRYGDPYIWYEYYGCFKCKKNRIGIDPKRFNKMISLTDNQINIMNKRNTTFYHPMKQKYSDYSVHLFVDEIDMIKNDYLKKYKPIIDKTLKSIKNMKQVTAGDYEKLQMGISGFGAATLWASIQNEKNRRKLINDKFELHNSLYAQFYHGMVSRIEAITVKVFYNINPKMKKFTRDQLYDNINLKKESSRNLLHFKYHDKMYSIWNFIKHNNQNTYDTLYENYREVLIDEKYENGDLAIKYVKLNEELILELLEGTKQYFIEWCELNLNEAYERSLWDYDEWFLAQIKDQIDCIDNPLGLTWIDEID